jgi:hypothetical protein
MGIAVLLGNDEGDLHAVLHAVALAQRTGEVVHGIRQQKGMPHSKSASATPSLSGMTLLMQHADEAGVEVRGHYLEGDDQHNFRALLREERIFYLIVGAKDEAEGRRVEKQLERLQKSIACDRRWSMRSFWAVVTGPWSKEGKAAPADNSPTTEQSSMT